MNSEFEKRLEDEYDSRTPKIIVWVINNALFLGVIENTLDATTDTSVPLTLGFYIIYSLIFITKLSWSFFQLNIMNISQPVGQTSSIDKDFIWYIFFIFRLIFFAIWMIPIILIVSIVEMLFSLVILFISLPILMATTSSEDFSESYLVKNLIWSYYVVKTTIRRSIQWVCQNQNTYLFCYLEVGSDNGILKGIFYFFSWIIFIFLLIAEFHFFI